MPPDGGIRFGRYRLLQELGAGGMAVVYRAVVDGPRGFARALVVKRILPEYSRNTSFVNMLASEARLCGLLRHPGIVQVHEFGEVNGESYLAMELVDGADLSTVWRASRAANQWLPAGLSCYVIAQLAEALAYAHTLTDDAGQALDIVHRDVSPSNIMLTALGTVKLLDFGIAKAASHMRDERTRTGTVKGKIAYMSPEQAEGLAIDRRSDIFSLGVIFHECLTMRRLFQGETDLERLRLVREAKVPPPSLTAPGLDPEIDAVALKMLARAPDDRYGSCDDVVAALRPIVHRHHGDAPALKRFLAGLPLAATPQPRPTPPLISDPENEIGLQVEGSEQRGSRPSVSSFAAGTMTGSHGEMQPTSDAQALGREPRRMWVAAAAGALAGMLLLGVWTLAHELGGRSAPPAPLVVSGPAAPSPAASQAVAASAAALPVEHVRLRLAGPSGAEVLVDGRLVGQLPLDIELERRAADRRVVVQHKGYTSWSRVIAGDTTVGLTATLQRKRAAAPSEPKRTNDVYNPFER
jgi:serine/threonine protein kinase